MKPNIDFLSERGHILRIPVLDGVTCPQCGSGEVYQPMQTMNMPMRLTCLRCGLDQPLGEFDIVE